MDYEYEFPRNEPGLLNQINNKNDSAKKEVYIYKKAIKRIVLIGLFAMIFFLISRMFFFFGLFIIANLLFYYMIRKLNFSTGIELSTISTIMIGVAYGPLAGVIMGLLGRTIEGFASRRVFSLATTLPLYALLGYTAGALSGSFSISVLGIVLSLAYAMFAGFLTLIILQGRISKVFLFAIIQIGVSIAFFIHIAPFLIMLMA